MVLLYIYHVFIFGLLCNVNRNHYLYLILVVIYNSYLYNITPDLWPLDYTPPDRRDHQGHRGTQVARQEYISPAQRKRQEHRSRDSQQRQRRSSQRSQ